MTWYRMEKNNDKQMNSNDKYINTYHDMHMNVTQNALQV